MKMFLNWPWQAVLKTLYIFLTIRFDRCPGRAFGFDWDSFGSLKLLHCRLPETGETLETKVEILMEYAGMTQVYIKVYCRDRLIATSQMKTVLAK